MRGIEALRVGRKPNGNMLAQLRELAVWPTALELQMPAISAHPLFLADRARVEGPEKGGEGAPPMNCIRYILTLTR